MLIGLVSVPPDAIVVQAAAPEPEGFPDAPPEALESEP